MLHANFSLTAREVQLMLYGHYNAEFCAASIAAHAMLDCTNNAIYVVQDVF